MAGISAAAASQQDARHHRRCSAMVANICEGGSHGRSRISNGQDLLPISTAVVTSRKPSSPIIAAPITARRRKGTSRRGYYGAQFESAWARYCAEGVTASQPSNVAYIGNR